MTRNKKLVKMMALAVAASTVATSVPAYAAFDATYYAQQNPDVVAAIGTKPADLETHYNVFGKKEGRAGSADEIGSSALRQLFDAEYYAKMNPDVAAVYGNDANALFSHFLQFGIKEGRRINPYFDVNAYKKAYPDLVAAFGDDIAAYYNHFATNGIKEHRTLGGFPAEKIVPGGVAVASSGGSSSSSSGGGGGSSKPAPKPADVTPAPDPTPTPAPEPEPEPEVPDTQEAAESIDLIIAANAIDMANDELGTELYKYYGGGARQNATPITKAECEALVDQAITNLNDADLLRTITAENYELAVNEHASAVKALEAANDAVKAAAKTNSALSAFRETSGVVVSVDNALTNYYNKLYDLEQAKIDVENKTKVLEAKKAEAQDAQNIYDKAFENVKTTLLAVDSTKTEADLKGEEDAAVYALLVTATNGATITEAGANTKMNGANTAVANYSRSTTPVYDTTTKQFSTSVYNAAKRAITEDVEKEYLYAAQLAYINAFIADPNNYNSATNITSDALKTLAKWGIDATGWKSDDVGGHPQASVTNAAQKLLTADSNEIAKTKFKLAGTSAAYDFEDDVQTIVLDVDTTAAAKALSKLASDEANTFVTTHVDTPINEYKATVAAVDYDKAKTDKDNADLAVTTAESNKKAAENTLEDEKADLKAATADLNEAKEIRDEAYEAAGVDGAAELLARDEAQETEALEGYEERLAEDARDAAKAEYDDAMDNYADASKLVEKP